MKKPIVGYKMREKALTRNWMIRAPYREPGEPEFHYCINATHPHVFATKAEGRKAMAERDAYYGNRMPYVWVIVRGNQ